MSRGTRAVAGPPRRQVFLPSEEGRHAIQRMGAKMRALLIAALATLLVMPAAYGQTSVTSQRIGSLTVHSGTVAGEPVSGTSQAIGSHVFTSLRVGDRSLCGTRQRIGALDFESWSDGTSAVTQRIGRLDFTTFSDGMSATTQRIGSFRFTTFSDGSHLTTQRIGSLDVTTGAAPRRSWP